MTKDEAFEKLVENVEMVGSGTYKSVEVAICEAARALNYIMDNIEEGDGAPLSASQIRKEAKVTKRDQQIARQAAKEGTYDNPSR